MGVPIIIGRILNVIVFLSLQIYRDSSSAFYLTVVSIVNIGQLLTGFLSRVLVNIVDTNWLDSSPPFCKTRYYIFQSCSVISPTCLCLAIINEFSATSGRPRWRRWSNLKMAYSLTTVSILFWLVINIPAIFCYNVIVSSTTGIATCAITNVIYLKYYNVFYVPALMCGIPVCITIIFDLLAYYNVTQLAYRTVPLVRRRHEAQLTIMVLIQVILYFFTVTPTITLRTIISNTGITNDPITAAQLQLANAILTCIYQCNFAVSLSCFLKSMRNDVFFIFSAHFICIFVCLNDFGSNFATFLLIFI
jgi:hypothetical protein